MTVSEILDAIATNWGLEDPNTVEAFNMAERGETAETLTAFRALVDGAHAEDDFGFDL